MNKYGLGVLKDVRTFRENRVVAIAPTDKPDTEFIILSFVLNSAEHELCPADKSQITNNCKIFLAKHS